MSHKERIADYYAASDIHYQHWSEIQSPDEAHSCHCGFHSEGVAVSQRDSLEAMAQFLLARGNIQPGNRILDAGCGVGQFLFEIAKHYPDTERFGINIAPHQIQTAERLRKARQDSNTSFALASYDAIPFPDESFDRIYFIESSGHAEEQETLLQESYRVLKPSGKILVTEPLLATYDLTDEEEVFADWYREGWHIPNMITPQDFLRYAQNVGLKVESRVELAREVFPSVQRFGVNAEKALTRNDDVPDIIRISRQACVATYELMRRGKMTYLASTLTKS